MSGIGRLKLGQTIGVGSLACSLGEATSSGRFKCLVETHATGRAREWWPEIVYGAAQYFTVGAFSTITAFAFGRTMYSEAP